MYICLLNFTKILMGIGLISYSKINKIKIDIDPDDFARAFIKNVDKRLHDSYVFKRRIFDRQIEFKGSVFRWVWNSWDLFNNITEGEIEFETEGEDTYISYKISFTELFTISFLFTVIPLSVDVELFWRITVFILIWFFYAFNYLFTAFRFNGFIAETLIETGKDTRYEFMNDEAEVIEDDFGSDNAFA